MAVVVRLDRQLERVVVVAVVALILTVWGQRAVRQVVIPGVAVAQAAAGWLALMARVMAARAVKRSTARLAVQVE
jgi:hypothetical protein